jgi:DnaJ-class molecular chaperone
MQQDSFGSFLGAGAAQPWENVDSILKTLEDQQSLLTGMFRDFVREASSQHKATPSGTSAAAGPAAAAAAAGGCSMHTGASSGHHPQQQHVQEQRAHALKRSRATELPLNVTLEELYSGTVKRVPVQLRRQNACTGAPLTVVQQLQVCVQPGLHAGTRITLPG